MLKRSNLGWTAALCLAIAWGGTHAGCGSDGSGSQFGDGTQDSSVPSDGGTIDPFGDSATFGDGGGTGVVTSLKIAPADPTVTVTIMNGVVTAPPVTFTATDNNGATVPVSWSVDRGELGSMVAASGVFTAAGGVAGVGNVTAQYQAISATTTVTVLLKVVQNGGAAGLPDGGTIDAGAGGVGGVGGEGPGGPVDPGGVGILNGPPAPTPPANAAELGFLYPYDKTVWPRGILAPLLQWQTTHPADSVYIHMSEKNYDFQGYYSGSALVHQPIDSAAWRQATNSNSGDPLQVSVVIASGGKAYGPITQSYTVAPGVLKGTVYYNSYNSHLIGGGNGAVLSIKPGAQAPTVAVAGTETACHVCHEVSADGSTVYFQDDTSGYTTGSSYDLRNNGAIIQTYVGTATSSDGSLNDRKFLWSGVYPDGTFAMTNSRHAREHNSLDSTLRSRADGNAIASTGWTNAVTTAVTPIFSPDGKHLAFNFWDGPGGGGVTPGAGHSLAITDFDCGKPDGGTACQGPYAFTNLRELYRDAARYPGWPGFLPDSSGIVYHNTVTPGTCCDNELATWMGAQAELWYVNATGAAQPIRMDALNGLSGGASYLPVNGAHPNDTVLNYEPTMNPIVSGGYAWVVFSTRRIYGNIATGDPYAGGDGTTPIPKKLWVAAIDLNPTPGKDPSHPAFYLPGQELNAGNLRGFWAVDPCHTDGTTCETGDECCGGFCRAAEDGGGLVCQAKPPAGCSQEFENCKSNADCCGSAQGYTCINSRCAKPTTK